MGQEVEREAKGVFGFRLWEGEECPSRWEMVGRMGTPPRMYT
jgi:hypothetical protein